MKIVLTPRISTPQVSFHAKSTYYLGITGITGQAELSKVSIEPMGDTDIMLFGLLALSDICVLLYRHRRRQRRYRMERMMRSLRAAVRREIGGIVPVPVG